MNGPAPMPTGRAYDPTFFQPYVLGQKFGVGGSPGTVLQAFFYFNFPSNYYDGQGNVITVQQAQAAGLKGDFVE